MPTHARWSGPAAPARVLLAASAVRVGLLEGVAGAGFLSHSWRDAFWGRYDEKDIGRYVRNLGNLEKLTKAGLAHWRWQRAAVAASTILEDPWLDGVELNLRVLADYLIGIDAGVRANAWVEDALFVRGQARVIWADSPRLLSPGALGPLASSAADACWRWATAKPAAPTLDRGPFEILADALEERGIILNADG